METAELVGIPTPSLAKRFPLVIDVEPAYVFVPVSTHVLTSFLISDKAAFDCVIVLLMNPVTDAAVPFKVRLRAVVEFRETPPESVSVVVVAGVNACAAVFN